MFAIDEGQQIRELWGIPSPIPKTVFFLNNVRAFKSRRRYDLLLPTAAPRSPFATDFPSAALIECFVGKFVS